MTDTNYEQDFREAQNNGFDMAYHSYLEARLQLAERQRDLARAALQSISKRSVLLTVSASLWSASDQARADANNKCAMIADRALEEINKVQS